MPSVALLGDVLLDLALPVHELPRSGEEAVGCGGSLALGGSAVHTARWLTSWGVEARLVGCVGNDPLGEFAAGALERAGVTTEWLQVAEEELTGLCCVLVEPSGERTMFAHRGANARLAGEAITEGWLEGVGWLHISGYALLEPKPRMAALEAAATARAMRIPISFDPGMAVVRHGCGETWMELGWVDVLLPNWEEARAMTGSSKHSEALAGLLEKARSVLLKCGENGCWVGSPRGCWKLPALSVEVRDTTGAGDAFNAGAICARLWGEPEPLQGAMGNTLGALCTQGGTETAPAGPAVALDFLDGQLRRNGLPEPYRRLEDVLRRRQGGANAS